jgi:Family of unknown function (DUF6459)
MSARPALRRYEGVVPVASVQGTLALELTAQAGPRLAPPTASTEPGLRPVADVVAIEEPLRRRVEQWAQRYVQAAVEIVGGHRPASQLLRWTRPDVYADLSRRAQLVARAAGRPPGQGRPHQAVRPQVVSVRASFVSLDVCEVSVRVRHGERFRAIAARFESLDGRLQCTALEFA